MSFLISMIMVALGGAGGAASRWGLAVLMERRAAEQQESGRTRMPVGLELMPWATFTANILACFLLGILVMRLGAVGGAVEQLYVLLGVGYCGALSTVSTAALDVVNLVRRGAPALALGYVLVTVGTGMAALWVGLVIAA